MIVDLEELNWEPTGDVDPGDDPLSRLSADISMSTEDQFTSFHAEAIEVDPDDRNRATNISFDSTLTYLRKVAGESDDKFGIVRIHARIYVVVIFPFYQ